MSKRMTRAHAAVLSGLILLCSCASSSRVIVGNARPPIAPSEVKLYAHAPPQFEEIAVLNASSHSVFRPGGQAEMDRVIERLKAQAAEVGANGLILEGFSDVATGSVGTGVGSQSYGRSSAVGVGVGGGMGIFKKTGQARAIFVP
jgi:hypothetical protein